MKWLIWLYNVYNIHKCTYLCVLIQYVILALTEWTDFFVDGETNVLMFGVGDMRSSSAVIRIIDDYLCEGSEKFDLVVEIDSETAEKVQLSNFNKLPITIIDNEGRCVVCPPVCALGTLILCYRCTVHLHINGTHIPTIQYTLCMGLYILEYWSGSLMV